MILNKNNYNIIIEGISSQYRFYRSKYNKVKKEICMWTLLTILDKLFLTNI